MLTVTLVMLLTERSLYMLIEVEKDFYEEVLLLANALHISPGEYLKIQHNHQKDLKSILFSEKEKFTQFVEEYKFLLDELFFLSNNVMKSLNELEYSKGMQEVFQELNTLVGEDIGFITKLYVVYKEQNSDNLA